MKITKSQLKKIIREELLKERGEEEPAIMVNWDTDGPGDHPDHGYQRHLSDIQIHYDPSLESLSHERTEQYSRVGLILSADPTILAISEGPCRLPTLDGRQPVGPGLERFFDSHRHHQWYRKSNFQHGDPSGTDPDGVGGQCQEPVSIEYRRAANVVSNPREP